MMHHQSHAILTLLAELQLAKSYRDEEVAMLRKENGELREEVTQLNKRAFDAENELEEKTAELAARLSFERKEGD